MKTIWAIFRFVALFAALLFPQIASAEAPAPKAETRVGEIDVVVQTSLKATSLCAGETRSAQSVFAAEVVSRCSIVPRGGPGFETVAPGRGAFRQAGPSGTTHSPGAVVLGEGMGDIKTVAKALQGKGLNAKWYQAWSKNFPKNRPMTLSELAAAKARNQRWIDGKLKDGHQLIDIGRDGRPVPSPFYALEKEAISKSGARTIPHPRPKK